MKTLTLLMMAALLTVTGLQGAEGSKSPAKGKSPKYQNIGVEEFAKLRANKENRVLDVRTAKEFATGHMPGAINIDINAPDFEQKVSSLDKTKTYLVHCAAGVRSARACGQMSGLNFPSLYNLEGGFRAWEKAGKPVEK
jgi:rhodanese-related sulfurtransferase